MTDERNYISGSDRAIISAISGGLKYGSLLLGIYSICKDEKDFVTATFAGATYILGSVIKTALREYDRKRIFRDIMISALKEYNQTRISPLEQKLESKESDLNE